MNYIFHTLPKTFSIEKLFWYSDIFKLDFTAFLDHFIERHPKLVSFENNWTNKK